MCIYLLVFSLLVKDSAGFPLERPKEIFSSREGSTVILPCDCRNMSNTLSSSESPQVNWDKDSAHVMERSGNVLDQAEEYKGRADVPEDKFVNGDYSLELKSVRAEDAGKYRCSCVVNGWKTFGQPVELSVVDKEIGPDVYRDGRWSPGVTGGVTGGMTGGVTGRMTGGMSAGVIGGVSAAVIVGVIVLVAVVLTVLWKKWKNGRGGRLGDVENQQDQQDIDLQTRAQRSESESLLQEK